MRVLGIDCGLSTGWAVVEDGKCVESGVEDFRPRRGSSYGMLYMKYRRWLSQMIQPKRPGEKRHYNLVVYEKSFQKGQAARELQLNMAGRVQEAAAAAKIEYVDIPASTLKKETVGKGNASKDEMKKWAAKILGIAPVDADELDDNEADAIAMAMHGYKKYSSDPETDPEKPLEDLTSLEVDEKNGEGGGADGMGSDALVDFV